MKVDRIMDGQEKSIPKSLIEIVQNAQSERFVSI